MDIAPVTFVLVPGAGGQGWVWHRLVPELQARGHDAVAVDLPSGDDDAGLEAYTDVVLRAAGDREEVAVVTLSMGALTGPLVCARRPVRLLVLVNPMIPTPGETGGAWWTTSGYDSFQNQPGGIDPMETFFHDVPPDVVAEAFAGDEPPQSSRPFDDPWPLPGWPAVPTRVLVSREDRFFPVAFQRRIARERLGLVPDEMPGGHLVPLSRPAELADRLVAYLSGVALTRCRR